MVLVVGAEAITHIPSMKSLEVKLKVPITKINSTFKQINTFATQHAHSILVHKWRLENQKYVADPQDPPQSINQRRKRIKRRTLETHTYVVKPTLRLANQQPIIDLLGPSLNNAKKRFCSGTNHYFSSSNKCLGTSHWLKLRFLHSNTMFLYNHIHSNKLHMNWTWIG